jgi:hypothetical protein
MKLGGVVRSVEALGIETAFGMQALELFAEQGERRHSTRIHHAERKGML